MRKEKQKINRSNVCLGVVVFFALFVLIVGKISANNRQKKATNKKVQVGISKLKKMESQDVGKVQKKIEQASRRTVVRATTKKTDEQILKQNYRKIFANSVFMGDSITEAVYSFEFVAKANVIAEKGVALTALDSSISQVKSVSPENVFLGYGSNDIGHVGKDYKRFRKEYDDMIVRVKKAVPSARIYANAIFPVKNIRTAGTAHYKDVSPYNRIIKDVCEKRGVTYMDFSNLVEDKYYEQDGYHFVRAFYPYWLNAMAEAAKL